MGTRSTIALEFADGTIGQVYCHWDGYLDHNGCILLENYTDPFKLREVIDLGDLSSLSTEIGVKHPFDNPYDFRTPEYMDHQEKFASMCKFYGRDRGEEGVSARYFKNVQDYFQNGQREEYNYILTREQGWLVSYDEEADFVDLKAEFWKEVTV